MKPGETIRIACGDCNVVFDLCVAPTSEWPEEMDPAVAPVDQIDAVCCPFCGASAGELGPLHDRPTHAAQIAP